MWVLVAYDVPDDGRRARLHRRLKGLLTPVQRSVFEGEIHPRHGLVRLRRIVLGRIDPAEDDVRIYVLCAGCRGSTILLGRARRVPDPRDPIVV